MVADLLTNLLSSARELAGAVIILIVAVYASGFSIVNTYLWKIGVVRPEIFRPTFVSAGLLFIFVEVSSALGILIILAPISGLLEKAHNTLYNTEPSNKLKRLLTTIGIATVAIVIFGVGIWPYQRLISVLIARLLYLSTGLLFPPPDEITVPLEIVMRLQGLAFLSILLLINHRAHFGRVSLSVATAIAGLIFIAVQAYTLPKFADTLYEQLPVSFGGGKPARVVFFIKAQRQQLAQELGIVFDSTSSNNAEIVLKTEEMQLIWQASNDAGIETTYLVRPCKSDEICKGRFFEIPKALVEGVEYVPKP